MGLKLHQVKALWETLKIKNFVEIALCSTVFEILAFLCFAIFAQKFKMAAIFGKTNFFLKIGMSTLKRHPVGQKFRRNRSI